MVLLTVLCCVFVLQIKSATAATNTGREFIVVFLEHIVNSVSLDIYITTSMTTTVNVNISVPLLSSDQSPVFLTVTRGERAHAAIEKSIALIQTKKAGKGILIVSDGDINVQCFSTSTNSRYTSVGGYLALPLDALGMEYMVAMYRDDNSYICAVVGIEEGTVVEVVIKLPSGKKFWFKGNNYYNGDTIRVTIDRYEAVQFLSSTSFVGSMLTASKKVAVFVGSDYTSVRGDSMDHIIEQLAPLNTWGMEYILIPFPRLSSFDIISVTAQLEDTRVELYGVQYTIMEAGSSVILKLTSDAPAYLSSNKRILVLQISASHDLDTTDYTDPSMLAVPPVNQWLSEYTFASVVDDSDVIDPLLVLVTTTGCLSQVEERDGKNAIVFTWTAIAGTPYSFSYSTIPEDFYAVGVTGNDACPTFGAFLYGPGFHTAWSMSGGQTFNTLPDSKNVTDPSSSVVTEATSIFTTEIIIETSSLEIYPSSSSFEVPMTSSSFEIPVQESSLTRDSSSFDTLDELSLLVGTSFLSSSDEILPTSTIVSAESLLNEITSYIEPSSSVPILSTSSDVTLHIESSSSLEESFENKQSIQYSSSTASITSSELPSSSNAFCTCMCKTPVISKEEIQRKLIVNKTNLSSTKRKLYSVVDNRPSSVAIGSIGLVFVSITLALIASMDLFAGIHYLFSIVKKPTPS